MRKLSKAIVFLCCFAMLLTGCSQQTASVASDTSASSEVSDGVIDSNNDSSNGSTDTESGSTVQDSISDVSSTALEISEEDRTAVQSGTNPITLNGDSISYSGSGAIVDGSTITITVPGTYTLSGKLNDGQVIINCEEKGTVSLVLDNAEISCSISSPIYILQAKKTVITLADGSTNVITDGAGYVFADGETEPDAAIFSKDDLTFNGTGALAVNANYSNGIVSKDTLVFAGGVYIINAVNNAIKGKDYTAIGGGTFDITCGGNGIKATNDTDAALGYVAVYGGDIKITSDGDGIQAYTDVRIEGGALDITSNGGAAANTAKHTDNFGGFGGWDMDSGTDTETDTTSSCKGIKAGGNITVNGGTLTIDANDDALHCAATAEINSGKLSIKTGDDGIHADTLITVNGGEIDISQSYEGIEALTITVNDGTINVVASDDGFNVNGEETGMMGGNPFGGATESTESSDGTNVLTFNGGKITVDASGDGLDSNGSVVMTGGDITVFGPTNDGNGALDYGSTFLISGGTLIVAGSSGMTQAPSTASEQASISVGGSFTAGQVLTLKDESGNTVISFTAAKQCASVVLSSPLIVNGGTYTFYADDAEIGSVTLSSQLGKIGTVTGTMGGFGGGMGGGGRHNNDDGTMTKPDKPNGGDFTKPDDGTFTMPEMNADGTITMPDGSTITMPEDGMGGFGGMTPPSTENLPNAQSILPDSDSSTSEASAV